MPRRLVIAWALPSNWRGGIGWRLLIRVLVFSSVITLVLTLVQLYLDYRRDVRAIDQRMSEIDIGYVQTIGEGLWRMEVRQLQLQIDAILRLPDIRYVELREVPGQRDPLVLSAGSRLPNPPARAAFKIIYSNRGVEQTLGTLVVDATYDQVYRRLLDTFALIMFGQAIKTFLVSFFILLIVDRLISRHLTAIATSLKEYDSRHSQSTLRLKRHPPPYPDELDDLVRAFNQREAALREAERRNFDTQVQLAHASRVATMGQLTASIAHEVNQPIGAILITTGTALRWLGSEPPELERVTKAIERIAADSTRAGEIISRIRSLVKKGPEQIHSLDINELISGVIGLAKSEISNAGISIQTGMADDLPRVWGDQVQLQQVMLNLIINAIEAMSASSEGSDRLSIETSQSDSNRVLITVGDTGPGLPAGDPDRLFDAFYTTKASGLGMGLSICRSIVEAHGGLLWAKANELRGAVFCVTLPVVRAFEKPET